MHPGLEVKGLTKAGGGGGGDNDHVYVGPQGTVGRGGGQRESAHDHFSSVNTRDYVTPIRPRNANTPHYAGNGMYIPNHVTLLMTSSFGEIWDKPNLLQQMNRHVEIIVSTNNGRSLPSLLCIQ